MKNFNFKIDRSNDDKDINDLVMKLGLYSDKVNVDYDPENYIDVKMQIEEDINEDALWNLVSPFRYRG